MGVPWLRSDGTSEWGIDKIDPCEAGTCGHVGCWQEDEATTRQREWDRADAYVERHRR